MIQKRETCLYCGNKMESKTAKKKFCSGKCKVYWNREKENRVVFGESGSIIRDTVNHTDLVEYAKGTNIADEVGQTSKPDNYPARNKGESSLDYRIRLAEWRQNQTSKQSI